MSIVERRAELKDRLGGQLPEKYELLEIEVSKIDEELGYLLALSNLQRSVREESLKLHFLRTELVEAKICKDEALDILNSITWILQYIEYETLEKNMDVPSIKHVLDGIGPFQATAMPQSDVPNQAKSEHPAETTPQTVGVEAEAKAKPAVGMPKRLPVTRKVASALCGVTEKQIGKWDKGVQMPERYPGRYNLAVLKPWAESYQQTKLISKAARAMNHASPMDPKTIVASMDEGSGNGVFQLEEHEQNQNRRRKSK